MLTACNHCISWCPGVAMATISEAEWDMALHISHLCSSFASPPCLFLHQWCWEGSPVLSQRLINSSFPCYCKGYIHFIFLSAAHTLDAWKAVVRRQECEQGLGSLPNSNYSLSCGSEPWFSWLFKDNSDASLTPQSCFGNTVLREKEQ